MVSDDEDSEGVIVDVVGERQRIALTIEPGRGIWEAWDNEMRLDIGSELEEDTATIGLDELVLEHKRKTKTLGGEITLRPEEEDAVTPNESEVGAVQVRCMMA